MDGLSAECRGGQVARQEGACSCEILGRLGAGCRVAVVAATDLEAAAVEEALINKTVLTVATKRVTLGSLARVFKAEDRQRGRLQGRNCEAGVRVALAVSGCDKANAAHMVTVLLECLIPRPSLVIQVGVGGALPTVRGAVGPRVGDVVVASSEEYADTGASSPGGWLSARDLGLPIAVTATGETGGVFPLDASLVVGAARIIEAALTGERGVCALTKPRPGQVQGQERPLSPSPVVWVGPCITASTATGTRERAMELAERFGALVESMEGAAAAHICALYGIPFLEIRGVSNLVEDRNRESWRIDLGAEVAGRATLAVLSALDKLPFGSTGES